VRARLRIVARLAAFVLVLLVCVTLYYAWRLLPGANPWPRRFLGTCARITGARPRSVGRPAGDGTVFLANHVSWLDILVLAGASGTAFVAHSGLATHKPLKWLCDMNRTVFIARDDRGRVAEQVEQVRAALRQSGSLTIFPEGTTSDGTGLLPFKSALLSALEPPAPGMAVQPVWIDYGAARADAAWVGDDPGGAHVLRTLARPGSFPVAVHFLEPLDPAAFASRKAIAAEARARIAAAMAARV
jgi:1-acyl-sn-glycerol-3-phosphate acyltransferase